MKRLILSTAALVLGLGLTGCVKLIGESTVKNDGSGTVTMNFAMKSDLMKTIKDQLANMGVDSEEMGPAFKEMEALFDEKKLAEELKKSGLTIESATSTEKDGWKHVNIKGGFADINAWIAQSKKATQSKLSESGMGDFPIDKFAGMGTPTFYSTDKPGIGKCVIIPPLTELFGQMDMNPLEMLDEMGEEEMEQAKAALDMFGGMFHLSEMSMGMNLTLPGKILSAQGCTQKGDNTVTFNMKGADISVDKLKNLFGLKNGVSCTFTIPEGCKIKFEDPATAGKKAEKKEAGDKAEKGEEKEETEKKEKKGALKIGG